MSQKDKAQSERFIQKAKELEADESVHNFEQVFEKIVPRKNRKHQNKPNGKTDR